MARIAPGIVVDEKICFGKPVIEGTRVPVELVLGQLAAGLTVEAVAEEYGLTRDAVLATLAYAARVVASEDVRTVEQVLRFLLDENVPRSLARSLRESGFGAVDVRDIGLRGRSDNEILEYARANGLILLTRDVGFGNVFRFPVASHAGVVVVRFPNQVLPTALNAAVIHSLRRVSDVEISGNVVIIEPGKIRLLRKSST